MSNDPTSLERLHDLVVPTPVPWWPPTPGWWIVLALLAIALVALLGRMLIHWQRNRYRRDALNLVDHLLPEELPGLVKRVALSAWPREQVAHLTGQPWLAFLDRTGETTVFTTGAGRVLESLIYQPIPQEDLSEMRRAIRHWIRNHRRERTA